MKGKANVIRLSKSAIDAMEPNTKLQDAMTPGLQVWAGAKTKTFYLLKHGEGRWKQIKIGRWPDMSIIEARAVALERLGAIANHQDIEAPSARRDPTIADAMDFFTESARNERHRRDAIYCFKKFAHLRERRVIDVTESDIREVFDSMEDTPVMANHCIKRLRTAIKRLAERLDMSLPDPTARIQLHREFPRQRFLTDEEAPRLKAALEELQGKRIYAVQVDAILLMVYTGLRRSNALGMRFSWLHGDNLVIPYDEFKNRHEQVLQLNKYALAIIEKRRQEVKGDYVFPPVKASQCPHLQDVRKTFSLACRMAGVPDCHPHDLRRSLGSWMLMNGESIAVISRTLGHRDIRTTQQVYAHLLPDVIGKATQSALDKMLQGGAPHQ